jgi:hypothetical protein
MLESMAAVAPGVGIILGGTLAALFSPRAAYLAAGVGLVALITAAALSRVGATEPARVAAADPGSA